MHLFLYCLAVPKLYPQEVYVHSLSSSSVRVTWRGISTSREEETLSGYMVRVDDIMTDLQRADDIISIFIPAVMWSCSIL